MAQGAGPAVSSAEEAAALSALRAEIDGATALFADEYNAAEAAWRSHGDAAGCLFGLALLQFIRAAFTFEDAEMEAASSLLPPVHCAARAADAAAGRRSGWLPAISFSGWSDGGGGPTALAELEAVRAAVAAAGAEILSALLGMFRLSVPGYVAMMLSMRRAHHAYAAAEKRWLSLQRKQRARGDAPTEAEAALATAVQAGLDQGLGVLNLVLGALPPKLASLVGFFGLRGESDEGVARLKAAWESGSGTLYAPVAALALLGFHSAMQIFRVAGDPADDAAVTDAILKTAIPKHPGAFFRYMEGRVARGQHRLDDALDAYGRIPRDSWHALRHIAAYETGWVRMLRLEYAAATECFAVLASESQWSKAFYAYLEGVCHVQAGSHGAAAAAFDVIPRVARRSGPLGRPIPVEAFALRRAAQHADATARGVRPDDRLSLPAIELAYFWNGFRQCGPGNLAAVEAMLERRAANPVSPAAACSVLVMLAAAARLRGRLEECESRAAEAEAAFKGLKPQHRSGEEWCVPYARTERGLAQLARGDLQGAKRSFEAAQRFSGGFTFENRLHVWLKQAIGVVADGERDKAAAARSGGGGSSSATTAARAAAAAARAKSMPKGRGRSAVGARAPSAVRKSSSGVWPVSLQRRDGSAVLIV